MKKSRDKKLKQTTKEVCKTSEIQFELPPQESSFVQSLIALRKKPRRAIVSQPMCVSSNQEGQRDAHLVLILCWYMPYMYRLLVWLH